VRELGVAEAFLGLSKMLGKVPRVYRLYLHPTPILIFRNIVGNILAEYLGVDLASFRVDFLEFRHTAFHLQSHGHFGLGFANPAHIISLNFFSMKYISLMK
jgi:hypothetical protein